MASVQALWNELHSTHLAVVVVITTTLKLLYFPLKILIIKVNILI